MRQDWQQGWSQLRAGGRLAVVAAIVMAVLVSAAGRPAGAADVSGPPPNDGFAGAQALSGATGTVTGTNRGATEEPGEPLGPAGATVWYRWDPAAAASTTFSTEGSSFDTVLAVYTGTSVDGLTLIALNDDAGADLTSAVTFTAAPGETYHVQVGGFAGETGDVALHWSATAAPANDAFADAEPIAGSSGEARGTNAGAGREPGEPAHAGSGGASVWYAWTAPASGQHRFRTAGSDFDTLLAVYTGAAVDRLTLIAANDDTPGGGSQVDFQAQQGTVYAIAVDGWAGATGAIVLTWLPLGTGPPNDHFLAAEVLSGSAGAVVGTNDGATSEPGEPDHGFDVGRHTVWYRWTPAEPGVVTFSTFGSAFHTAMSAYTGSAVDRLTRVASGVDSLGDPFVHTTLTFLARSGVSYSIGVEGHRESTGELHLSWSTLPRPANDTPSSATVLAGADGSLSDSNVGATPDDLSDRGASVWYRWTAPWRGGWVFTTEGSSFDTVLAVHLTGKHEQDLVEVAVNDDVEGFGGPRTSEVALLAEAGTTYTVMVDGGRTCGSPCHLAPAGSISLRWTAIPLPANDHLADAERIEGERGSLVAWTHGASREPDEPVHAGRAGEGSIWYRWTPAASGRYRFEASSREPAALAVYTGTTYADLHPVAGADGVLTRAAFTATAGVEHLIALDGPSPTRVRLDWLPVPANDDFALATELEGPSGSVATSNVDATREPAEPDHAGRLAARSLWWRWTAPSSGPVVLHTHGSAVDTTLSVWTGEALDALTPVAANNDQGAGTASEVRFGATAGTTYRIAVDTLAGSEGSIVLSWRPPPAEDAFSAPVVLAGAEGAATVATHGATVEASEPNSVSTGASVWLRWTAPASGLYLFAPEATTSAIVVEHYGDAASPSALVALPTLPPPEPSSARVLDVRAGQGVVIRVAGRVFAGSPSTGTVTLRWAPLPPPANDDRSAASTLTGPSGRIAVATVGATAEDGEPPHAGGPARHSVWHRWTAPASGRTTFETEIVDFDTRLAAYREEPGGGLALLGENDDAVGTSGTRSRLRVEVAAGDDVLLAVDAVASPGRAWLRWDPTPANDDLAGAAPVEGVEGEATSSLQGASREPAEPVHGPSGTGASVWFRWTAPVDGAVSFWASDGAGTLSVAAYTGDQVGALVRAPGRGFPGGFELDATAGTTYAVAVEGAPSPHGPVRLAWVLLPRPTNDAFAAAQAIAGLSGAVEGTTLRATREGGEPQHAGVTGGGSVWYRWTAPSAGRFSFHTSGTDTVLAAYEGDEPSSLVEIDAQDDQPGLGKHYRCDDCKDQDVFIDARGSSVVVEAAAGQPVRLAVDGVPGPFRLRWAPVPANDALERAEPVAGPGGEVEGTTDGATLAAGDPIVRDADGVEAASHSVWFAWTAPADAVVAFEVHGVASRAVAVVLEGTGYGDLRLPPERRVGFQAEAGRSYRVAVLSGFSVPGRFQLRWRTVPANDDRADAETIDGPEGSSDGTTLGSTLEASEPPRSGSDLAGSVWYRWTAPHAGVFRFRVDADHHAVMDVYLDPDIHGFRRVEPLPELGEGEGERVVFATGAGDRHLIRVSADGDPGGAFRLAWDEPPPYVGVGDAFPQEEGDPRGDLGFVLFLSWPSNQPVRVGYQTVDGTARAPHDYSAVAGVLVVPPGETTAVIDVAVADDTVDEHDEVLSLELVSPVDGVVTRAVGEATILDDDDPPVASVAPVAVEEGDSGVRPAVVSVLLSEPSGKLVEVEVATAGRTATPGEDHLDLSGPVTVRFEPGTTVGTVEVPILGDVAIEGEEHVEVALVGAADAVAGPAGTLTIVDDDGPPVPAALAVSGPVPLGAPVALELAFSDDDHPDRHWAEVAWGDGSTSTVEADGRVVRASHAYAAAGVHEVTVTVHDSGGGSARAAGRAVVFDPAGRLTGEATTAGGAKLAVSLRYPEGADRPEGELDVRLGQRRFRASAPAWLVVRGGAVRAEALGALDGTGGHLVELWAVDGRPDLVRLRVTDTATGLVVHDDEPGAGAWPTGALREGNITVHLP